MNRPSRDRVLMDVAKTIARRSTCERAPDGVGAVLALEGRIISTGYAGAPSGVAHCREARCDLMQPCTRTVHAEANAIVFAARHGLATEGTVLYCTVGPCYRCAQLIINAGIQRVWYDADYRQSDGIYLLRMTNVPTEQLRPDL